MRQLRAFASILVVLALLVGPNLPAGAQPNVVTLRYATSLSEDSAYYKGAVALAQAADELSRGRLQIKIFANAQLGTDRDMIEGMQLGSIDLASPSTGAMGSVLPAATVLDLRKRDAQLAVAQDRAGLARVAGNAEPHDAGKAPVTPLDEVKAGVSLAAARGLFAGDEHGSALHDHPDAGWIDGWEVDGDLDPVVGFEDVE